jgi:hypothetical protein
MAKQLKTLHAMVRKCNNQTGDEEETVVRLGKRGSDG